MKEGMGDVMRKGWGREAAKVIKGRIIKMQGRGGDDIVKDAEEGSGSSFSSSSSSSSPDMFAGITFGSAVKGSPASVTSEDGEELESSLEMFDDVLGGGHGIMRGSAWDVYKENFAMRRVQKRSKRTGKLYYKKAKLDERMISSEDEDGYDGFGGEENNGGAGMVFHDIKAEGRKDGIKVVLDGDGNVKVKVREQKDLEIEAIEYDSDGEIIEDL
mmetsp:Transcript_19568/g.40851  ORF Transcript_19568/g.40851 Transcript_19568/m.40851 type:complete len:215 (+) Transcript_19568:178-822(+)